MRWMEPGRPFFFWDAQTRSEILFSQSASDWRNLSMDPPGREQMGWRCSSASCWERANQICGVAGAGNSSIEGKNILPSQSLGHVLGLLPSFSMVTVPSVFPPLEPAHITNWHVSHIWGGGGEKLYYWCTLTFGGIPPTYRSSFAVRLPECFGHSIAFPTCCRPLGSTYLCGVVIKTSTRSKNPRESIWDVTVVPAAAS